MSDLDVRGKHYRDAHEIHVAVLQFLQAGPQLKYHTMCAVRLSVEQTRSHIGNLCKAGLMLVNEYGHYEITEQGRKFVEAAGIAESFKVKA